jgi:phenylpropionate dioxygenase-like ring-hydroxylating dioxygenase large terminal subunit
MTKANTATAKTANDSMVGGPAPANYEAAVSELETLVVEFFYPEEIAAFEREFVEAQREAYMETAVEDDEIAERMDEGRRALLARGDNEVGPYQSPMEDGMQHFHEWYNRKMNHGEGSHNG